MTDTFKKKCNDLKNLFSLLSTEERYQRLIEMGRNLAPFPEHEKIPSRLVEGCQSKLYLYTKIDQGKLFFYAHSDALISSGLAALLITLYSGETPETVLKNSPDFIQELGIGASLSPTRSNGLANLLLKMKQEAIKFLC